MSSGFNAGLGLPGYSTPNLAGGLNSYSSVSSVDQYFLNKGLQNNPPSGGTFSFSAIPTREQLLNGQLNPSPTSPVTRTVFNAGLNLGQDIRNDWNSLAEASLAQRSGTNDLLSPRYYLDAAYSIDAALKYATGRVASIPVDIFLPPTPPSKDSYHTNGSYTFHDGEGLSTIAYANQASPIALPLFAGAARPAGQLAFNTARNSSTIAPKAFGQLDEVIASVNRNADIAVQGARQATLQQTVRNTPQAFGSRAAKIFRDLNEELDSTLRQASSPFRVAAEEFRSTTGRIVARNSPGSIGADAVIKNTSDAVLRVLDLKTFGTARRAIGAARQSEFVSRFGQFAEELFRQR